MTRDVSIKVEGFPPIVFLERVDAFDVVCVDLRFSPSSASGENGDVHAEVEFVSLDTKGILHINLDDLEALRAVGLQ